MGIELFEHNKTAYNAAISMLNTTGKAAIIHPTGTGKSFVALKLCEDYPEKRFCWLSPSEYIFRMQVENWNSVGGEFFAGKGFCAKEKFYFYTYAKLMHSPKSALAEICPDYIILDEFHRCGAAQWGAGVERLREMYPKAKILGLSATNIRYLDNQRDMAWELFDGNIASELTLGEAMVRGILPTPKYILSIYSYQEQLKQYEKRAKQAKRKAVRDLAEKLLEQLRRALEQADGVEEVFAKHLLLQETNKDWKEHRNAFCSNARATKQAEEENEQSFGRYLVFCASYDHLNKMKELAPEWFAKVDAEPHIYTVYSNDKNAAQEFKAFQADSSRHLKLLYCIDMLNEGIHLSDIDGVILLRPTVSPTIYKQQIGRALAAGGKKQPVIFDIVMNIENLYSIGAVEEEVREAVFSYRAMGKENEWRNESFQIIDEIQDCRRLFLQLNETLGASWDMMYAMAEEYYKKCGNLNVPKRYRTPDGYSLGAWIATQRKVYHGKVAGNLSKIQRDKLSAIGMQWCGARETTWEEYYAEAIRYYNEHGNLRVPLRQAKKNTEKKKPSENSNINVESFQTDGNSNNDKDNADHALARWLARLRTEWKKQTTADQTTKNRNHVKEGQDLAPQKESILTKERIAVLDAIGMVWDRSDFIWEQNFAAAENYAQEHGNLDVPSYYVHTEGVRLGAWIAKQRTLWKEQKKQLKTSFCDLENRKQNDSDKSKSILDKKKIARLTAIGMIWDKKSYTTWEKAYAFAEQYYQEHGNLDIPVTYKTEDGFRLGRWVRRQRDQYQKEAVLLKEEAVYSEKAVYREEINVRLKNGQTTQKDSSKIQPFSSAKERIQKLSQIGMIWENIDLWNQKFELAKKYYCEHGNLKMPRDYIVDGIWLSRWLREQKTKLAAQEKEIQKFDKERQFDTKKQLTKEQREKLYSIGIQPGISQSELSWKQQYKEAEEFYQEHGHLSIPKRYIGKTGKHLGVWIARQRANRKGGILTKEQIILLDGICMVWEFGDSWETGYQYAKEYYEKFHNLAVPNTYINADGYHLGKWISNQRSAYHKNKINLTQKQIKRLEEIEMIWNAKSGRKALVRDKDRAI